MHIYVHTYVYIDPVEEKMKEGKRRKKRLLYVSSSKALFRFSYPIGSLQNRHSMLENDILDFHLSVCSNCKSNRNTIQYVIGQCTYKILYEVNSSNCTYTVAY